jgi:ABC-type Fe3+-citrate transport system substrate-binding protein
LEEARHEEILSALKRIASSVESESKNEIISKSIENNTKEIANFGSKLGELEVRVDAPIVNVQTNQQQVIAAINELKAQGARIEQLLTEQNRYFEEMCRPKDYEFKFDRNHLGVMQSPITAKVKPTYNN